MRERPTREQDQLTVARLTGAAWRDASVAMSRATARARAEDGPGRPAAGPGTPEAAAVRELREMAGGRGDLLAEVAGLLIGYYRRSTEEARARGAAYLCIAAGAALDLLPEWIDTGGSRAAAARQIPPAVPETGLVYEWPEAV